MVSEPLSKDVRDIKIFARKWGVERCYRTPFGEKVCNKVPFERLYKSK